MQIAPRLLFIRLAALVALVASSALLVDYVRSSPAFCSVRSGCEAVMLSDYGRVLKIPVPALGIVAFALVMAVSLFPAKRRVIRFLGPMAMFAGLAGIGLILVQIMVLDVVCVFCMTADAAALGIAGIHLWLRPKNAEPEKDASKRWIWLVLSVLAIGAPLAWGLTKPEPPVADHIKKLWKPGKINVVEVTDFECPHCRTMHDNLRDVLREYGDRIHLIRIMMPMPIHSQARDAAVAYICAKKFGKEDKMADALFAHSLSLSPGLYPRLAEVIGVDPDEFRACLRSPSTDQQLQNEIEAARLAGVRSVPTLFVQDRTLAGSHRIENIRAALKKVEKAAEVK